MKTIDIQQPNGWMEDGKGRVCLKFAEWSVGAHSVPDYVEAVHYIENPAGHDVAVDEYYLDDVGE